MLKRVLFITALLCALVAPLQAQTPSWTAWLYNATDGSITQVNNAGEIVGAFGLPLPQAFNAYGNDILISPSGRYVVYTAVDTTVERPNSQLFVYDSQAQAVSFTYDITDVEMTSFSVAPKQTAFDERHSQVAVGLLRESGWEIIVIDYSVGSVLTSLTEADAVENDRFLPLIQFYDGVSVFFTAVSNEEQNSYQAFEWQIGSGEIRENAAFTSTATDIFRSVGEIIAATQDAEGLHVINVFPSVTNEGMTVYNDATAIIDSVYYIQNGQRVLAKTYTGDEYSLKVINRDGSMSGELVGSLDAIRGTPDGFIGLFPSAGGAALAFVDTTGSELNPVTVWTMEGVDLKSLKLAHVQSDAAAPTTLPEWTEVINDNG